MKLSIIALLLLLFPQNLFATETDLSNFALVDLWDNSHKISEISQGKTLLIYLCKPELSECREGAIYFESLAFRIRAKGAEPICVFLGKPEQVRDVAVDLGLRMPVFIDPSGSFFGAALDQRILPALIAIDTKGRRIATVYGGGDALATNLDVILAKISRDHKWLLITLIAVVTTTIVLILTR